jgi:hypothetical protein
LFFKTIAARACQINQGRAVLPLAMGKAWLAGAGYLGQYGAGLGQIGIIVLTLSQTLPYACLVGGEGAALGAEVAGLGGMWYTAHPDDVLVNGDEISGWRPRAGQGELRPSQPNQGNGQYSLDPPGFVLRTGVHCGYTLPAALATGECFTAAVIYDAPQEDIRTLFAVHTGAEGDMIFLSHSDGQILAKNRAGNLSAQVPLPVPQPGGARRLANWRLAIVAYTGRSLHLWAGGAQAQAVGAAAGMHAPADFFVGCRSNRAGLAKTLGAGLIRDVLLWPGLALLTERAESDLAPLFRYFRWSVA